MASFSYFSRNGELVPISEAHIALSNIEYQYGFGVYESIRVVHRKPLFLADHLERLEESARIIGLTHPFTRDAVTKYVHDLVEKTEADTYNLKILLIGGKESVLNILCLNPHYPEDKLYKEGVKTVTYEYERAFPHAKTLNMLQSYLAYSKAKEAGAYDALLIDRNGTIIEGTRTNFFAIRGKTLYEQPEENILLGVTRKHVLEVAAASGFTVATQDIRPHELSKYDGAFLTSTSSKIMPIRSVDDFSFTEISASLRELMEAFDEFLRTPNGSS